MKVAIYTRVSTEDQVREGTSLEVQREFLERFAKNSEWEIYYPKLGEIYQDEGYSGSLAKRPALDALIRDAKLKKFDIVLCYKVDRFARKNKLLLDLVELLENLGIGFKSATESFDTVSAAGKMALSMLGTVAQFERDRIIERVRPGMEKGVQKGNWQGARYSPYGYKYDKVKQILEVVPEEAKVVSLIYTMYSSNQSTRQIASHMRKKGYKSRTGGKFHNKLVCDILKNQIYLGKIVWNKKHYDKNQKTPNGFKYVKSNPTDIIEGKGRHEAIISQEEFDLVQVKLKRNLRGSLHRNSPSDYPLTGITFCAECGHKFRGANNTSNHNKNIKKRWYRCTAKQEHDIVCSNASVKAEYLEPQIFSILETLVNHPDIRNGRVDSLVSQDALKNDVDLSNKKKEFDSKLRENLANQKKLYDAYESNLIAIEIFKDKSIDLRNDEQNLRKEIAKIELQLIEKERSKDYQRVLNRILDNFDKSKDELDPITRKELLQLVFKSILLKDKKIVRLELYQPFEKYLNEQKCNINQIIPITSENSYIWKPTAAK